MSKFNYNWAVVVLRWKKIGDITVIHLQPVAYAGFFNGGGSVMSHRDDVSFSDVTATIMP